MWGIAPVQILPDKFSTPTTSISDSAPRIGNWPLWKRAHPWRHTVISVQSVLLNGKKTPLPSHTLCFSVPTPALSICGTHCGLFPSLFYASKNMLSPRFSMGKAGPSATVNGGTPSSLLRSIVIISISHNPASMMKAELDSINADRQLQNPELTPSMG